MEYCSLTPKHKQKRVLEKRIENPKKTEQRRVSSKTVQLKWKLAISGEMGRLYSVCTDETGSETTVIPFFKIVEIIDLSPNVKDWNPN